MRLSAGIPLYLMRNDYVYDLGRFDLNHPDPEDR